MRSFFSASTARFLLVIAALLVALLLQTTVFPHLAWRGVVPNLVLLVVVAAGLVRGSQFALVVGFGAGVLLD
ncbi:MAG: rod shape-determining protein MreD, partial [Nocardioides sp.]